MLGYTWLYTWAHRSVGLYFTEKDTTTVSKNMTEARKKKQKLVGIQRVNIEWFFKIKFTPESWVWDFRLQEWFLSNHERPPLFSLPFFLCRWWKLAVRRSAPPSPTFAPMISASWALYPETLSCLTSTVTVNLWRFQERSSLKTRPTRSPPLPNQSYLLLLNASTCTHEPCSPFLSCSSTWSTGPSTCERSFLHTDWNTDVKVNSEKHKHIQRLLWRSYRNLWISVSPSLWFCMCLIKNIKLYVNFCWDEKRNLSYALVIKASTVAHLAANTQW